MNCKRGFVKNITLVTHDDDAGRRLDRILRKALPDMPLSALHRVLRKGKVLVNGVPARGEDRLPSGARIELPLEPGGSDSAGETPEGFARIPRAGTPHAKTPRVGSGTAKLDILWEGAGLLILNKPSGLAVHGGGTAPDNLDRRVRAYLKGKLPPSLSFRPGPLHRLDKPTSGIIVFALRLDGAKRFSALLQESAIRKRYLAIVEGTLRESEVWEDTLFRDTRSRKTLAGDDGAENDAGRGQHALCRVTPLAWTEQNGAPSQAAARDGKSLTLIRVELETGRTHQIRAQAAAHGYPLAGDGKYGGRPLPGGNVGERRLISGGGFFLHARELELPEGAFPGIPRLTRAPLPEQFALALGRLFGDTCNKEHV